MAPSTVLDLPDGASPPMPLKAAVDPQKTGQYDDDEEDLVVVRSGSSA